MKLSKQQIDRRKKFRESLAKMNDLKEAKLENIDINWPVQPMGEAAALDVIKTIKNGKAKVDENGNVILDEHGDPVWSKHPTFFSITVFNEVKPAAEYRGGRGSEGKPFVRIFKTIYLSKCYSGYSYESLGAVKKFRQETGKERSDRDTGVNFNNYMSDTDLALKVADGANGRLFRLYLTWDCNKKSDYYITIDGGQLTPVSREEAAKYMTAGDAKKVLTPTAMTKKIDYVNPETGEVKNNVSAPQPVNNYFISNIVNIKSFNN